MASGRFVSYLRVSTARQGQSGLGLEAQRQAVTDYLNGGHWTLLGEFVEVESGKNNARPQLAAAMAECRLTGATLVIAKLDRLSRNAAFLMGLKEAGTKFVAADMPDANALTVGIMALVAEQEREAISSRTKAALAVVKISRQKAGKPPLGGYRGGPVPDAALSLQVRQRKASEFAARVAPLAQSMQAQGMSLRAIAAALEARNVRTPRGGVWTANAVMKVLAA